VEFAAGDNHDPVEWFDAGHNHDPVEWFDAGDNLAAMG
jgi:hypothetical protein